MKLYFGIDLKEAALEILESQKVAMEGRSTEKRPDELEIGSS
jgi:hypothetical protein